VAAVAALMQQAGGNRLTPQQVKDLLTGTALDMEDPFTPGLDPGYDFRTGYGFVRAEQAVTAAGDPCLNDVTPPTARAADFQAPLQNGTRTILATEIDKGSTDNCRVASITVSPSTFTCANLGPNQVTLTVTDPSGNVSTATATVTILGSIPTVPPIQVTPANATYTGGVATTFYLGYGPQSATLTASGGESYSWAPGTGLSQTNIANPVFTATTAGTFTYTVTATSPSGCTATRSVTLTVIDVRCSSNGKKMDKVQVCHKGNALCIDASGVADHLQHGDALGACASSRPSLAAAGPGAAPATGQLEAYPNPFSSSTTFRFRTPQAGPVRVQVYNSLGQLVTTLYDGPAAADQLYERTLSDKGLSNGLYTCRLTTSTGSVIQRVVLTR
jgi:PKD repeat protein